MHSAPTAGDVPAFRVINSKGFLSGAATFNYPGQQKKLLEQDGIRVRLHRGRRPRRFKNNMDGKPSMDEAEKLCVVFGSWGSEWESKENASE